MSDPSGSIATDEQLPRFSRLLLRDVRALEYMLEHDLIERDVHRIGAEQELFLMDRTWLPAPLIDELLDEIDDPRVVTELTRFNAEFNLRPTDFGGDSLSRMEEQIDEVLDVIRSAARKLDAEAVLTGILPTIRLADLDLENMTPRDRYRMLNDRLTRLRGSAYEFQIRGIDELLIRHDTVMLEGCNTSFQVHFQVDPDAFARYYNIAQAVTAPVLAAAVNSPLFFGRRLWRETRIALFQQSIDTRSSNLYTRELSPRVNFGRDWIEDSVLDVFKEDIARFQIVMSQDEVENPFEVLERGEKPRLEALQIHNGTVYRWNRACYGVHEGKAHLRIENRVLPSGPTPVDEVANAAFWLGLVSGAADEYGDITERMDFGDAKGNFMAAARLGLASQFTWLDGRRRSASDLICDELVPLAEAGLQRADIDEEDVERYLGIIYDRVRSGQTGAQWQLVSFSALEQETTLSERLNAIAAATLHRQEEGEPVHTWDRAEPQEAGSWMHNILRVEQCMTTDLFTVNEAELVEFVASLMDWRNIGFVPVEDENHRLVGLVSQQLVIRHLAHREERDEDDPDTVGEIMIRDPISVGPNTPTLEAIRLMREHEVEALPVVQEGHLIGIVTVSDFVPIAERLMDTLTGESES